MQTAVVDDQHEISAATLARRGLEERRSYRGRLSCPDPTCRADVHFRSQSANGRPALFYSNHHIPTCTERSPETKRTLLEVEREEDDAIWNDATELLLRLDSSAVKRSSTVDTEKPGASQSGKRHDPRSGNRYTHASSIGLRPLLRRLRDDPEFRSSDMELTLSDGTQGTVAQTCTHASDYLHAGGRRVIWGSVVRVPGGWINSGRHHQDLPAVRIPDAYLSEVLAHAHIVDFSDLSPSDEFSFDFIVEGVFRKTKNGTPFTTIEGANHLALLLSARTRDARQPSR